MPPGPVYDSQAMQQIRGNKRVRRKQPLKGIELFVSEMVIKEHVYILFENESEENYTF